MRRDEDAEMTVLKRERGERGADGKGRRGKGLMGWEREREEGNDVMREESKGEESMGWGEKHGDGTRKRWRGGGSIEEGMGWGWEWGERKTGLGWVRGERGLGSHGEMGDAVVGTEWSEGG